jgi:hypothetical protein
MIILALPLMRWLIALFLTFQIFPGLVHAQEKNADELAKELSNPATALASLNLNIEYRTFKGDLPNADAQDSWTASFQPAMPFPVGGGNNIFIRPLFPIILDQPVFNSNKADFDKKGFGLGDIAFDLAYGGTDKKTGLISLIGLFGSMPTATDDAIASDQWRLGPEVVLGIIKKWGVLGFLAFHSWDVGGSNDTHFSTTSFQYFYAFGLGNGWQLAAGPTITYDWAADDSDSRWAIPVGIGVSKTTKIGKTPFKSALEVQHYVDQPDAFGPEWFVKFKVTPVVKNPFANLFKRIFKR